MPLIERSFRERIVIVGVTLPPSAVEETEQSLDELERLVATAGADVVARVQQRRPSPDPSTYVGQGKLEELRGVAAATDCNTVVFDDELTPAQQLNLERVLGRTAIDRTAVILDIFAQNAHSREGKAQVELAQHRYRLPRIRGSGSRLSQQAGGIGTRGPGETQLEVDRRRLERRMHRLERELKAIGRHRATQRKRRRRGGLPAAALVGYTNAGKSTLLNRLTGSDTEVADRLFETLDPTTRRLPLGGGEQVLLTDTVGFVRKLPHQLVEAFKSTLEVVTEADLLVHVVDAAAPDPEGEMAAARSVLTEIGAASVPELVVFNKCDLPEAEARARPASPGSVEVSAETGEGIDALLLALGDRLHAAMTVVELLVPYERGDVLARVHREGHVLEERPAEGGMAVRARLDAAGCSRLAPFVSAEVRG